MSQAINDHTQQEKQRQLQVQPVTTEIQKQSLENSIEDPSSKNRKRRRHHRKSKVVKDPEEIKLLRMQKLNVKRERKWDSRFINQSIPNIFQEKLRKRRKTVDINRRRFPLQSAYIQKDKQTLPQLKQRMHNTANKQNSTTVDYKDRNFKIRQVRKESEPLKKEGTEKEQTEKIQAKLEEKLMTKKQKKKELLLIKLSEKTKIYQINPNYHELLSDLIDKATQKKHRSVRNSLQSEIQSIGTDKNSYNYLSQLVRQRLLLLKEIKQKDDTLTLKECIDFQMHSLLLVQQILKFKAKWQAIYYDSLNLTKKINFYFQDKNYLVQMGKQVYDIVEKDPFLVNKSNSLQRQLKLQQKQEQLKERKQMMLKIRACELLLIEEELIADKI